LWQFQTKSKHLSQKMAEYVQENCVEVLGRWLAFRANRESDSPNLAPYLPCLLAKILFSQLR